MDTNLFPLGSQSYVLPSHQFYLPYPFTNHNLSLLHTPHFHPTHTLSNKISSILLYTHNLPFHLSPPLPSHTH
ncbi:L-rhamnose isomerase, partial [Bacillus subtilis]|uniref:L-rhamnose isomerase n=1 Tax=Bacillus subtilis TaxID=1423 RepID=UPI002078C1DA